MHTIGKTFVKLATAASLALAMTGATGCYDEAYADPPVYYPSDGIVATEDPIYYEGQATYFYGGHWYYRGEGGRWNYYHSEPSYLRQYRGAHPGVMRGGVRSGARGGARGGGHGGRR
jgi:hypothetical protein